MGANRRRQSALAAVSLADGGMGANRNRSRRARYSFGSLPGGGMEPNRIGYSMARFQTRPVGDRHSQLDVAGRREIEAFTVG